MRRQPIRPTIRSAPAGPDPWSGSMPEQLREALSWWASGVAVLAVSDGEEVEAITVTAFSAVSLDPPLVLVCVNEQSPILPMLLEEGVFTVNLLAEDEQRTAVSFAQRLPFQDSPFPPEGPPVLRGALVSLVCRLWREYPGGDHRIVVGQVERVEPGRDAGPLLYFRRGYHALEDSGGG